MNPTKLFLLPGLALTLTLTLAANVPAAKIRFGPAEGSSLTKTFESKTDLSLDDMSIEGPAGIPAPDMEMTMTIRQSVTVEDEYKKLADGRPTDLVRTFDTISSDVSSSMKMEMAGQSRNADSSSAAKSELEGKQVAFHWDEEKGEHVKTFRPEEDKPDLLKGLTEDMDLRALLPEGDVKEGDEWDIDVSKIASVILPGGDLSLKPEEQSGEDAMGMGGDMSSMSSMIGEDIEGTAKGKLVALRETDGVQVAVIHVTIKISSKVDMTDTVKKSMEKADLPPEVGSIEVDHVDIEYTLEAEGDLEWNLAGGHFASFEISGATTMKSAQGMSIQAAGKNIAMEQTMEFSGTSSFSAKAK